VVGGCSEGKMTIQHVAMHVAFSTVVAQTPVLSKIGYYVLINFIDCMIVLHAKHATSQYTP